MDFLMLACYLDESTSFGEKDPTTCVAGYLASGKQWSQFEREWNSYLQSKGVEVFHAADYETEMGRRGTVYESWSAEEGKAFQNRLLEIIKAYTFQDVGVGIPHSVYEAVMTAERKRRFQSANALAAIFCMFWAGGWAQSHNFEAPSFFYESGGGYASAVFDAHQEMQKSAIFGDYYRLSSVTFISKCKEYPQTQPADLLAFNMSKRISHIEAFDVPKGAKTEMHEGREIRETRYPLQILYSESRPNVLYYTREGLERDIAMLEGADADSDSI